MCPGGAKIPPFEMEVSDFEVTKSESGRRYIAMDDEVHMSLMNMIARRPKAKAEMAIQDLLC